MNPRARRMALIVASVPLETNRTISTDGTASTTSSASSRFELARRAVARPVADRRDRRLDDRGVAVAEDHRPPRADEVEVAVAVEVEEVRPVAAGDEERRAADRAERPGRAVDAAGDDRLGALERGRARDCDSGMLTPGPSATWARDAARSRAFLTRSRDLRPSVSSSYRSITSRHVTRTSVRFLFDRPGRPP